MRVARLQGALLDYWVAQAEGLRRLPETPGAGAAHEPGSGWWPQPLPSVDQLDAGAGSSSQVPGANSKPARRMVRSQLARRQDRRRRAFARG